MKTIELTTIVGPDRKLIVQLPPEIPLGTHRVVVVIDEATAADQRRTLRFSAYPVGLAVNTFAFRREDLYGDDGR